MPKAPTIETLLKGGSAEWNRLRKAGKVPSEHTGATFAQLFSANADLSGLTLIGSEWEKCDLSKMNFRETDLSNAYFHGGRLQDCDFRNANLSGATFEKLKLLRCDFTGAQGLEELELDDVDMDRVVGLDGEEAPPPPPPPVHGATSFTREQRAQAQAQAEAMSQQTGEAEAAELPPFRPQDPPGLLLQRALKGWGEVPGWLLDAPGLRPPLPPVVPTGQGLEAQLREATRARLEGRKPNVPADVIGRAQHALRMSTREAAAAALLLRETGVDPQFRFSAAKGLKAALRAESEVDDLTGSIDPRLAGALWVLQLPHDAAELAREARRRLSAAQLFTALVEAGFYPDNNWEEALESSEPALELAQSATGGDREALAEGFQSFAALPEEARLRRLAYLAEATAHLENLNRLPDGVEPRWLHDPEFREHHEQEMQLVQALTAQEVPVKVAKLAAEQLGVPEGSVPEDSEGDLFIHLRCRVCDEQKLLVQSP